MVLFVVLVFSTLIGFEIFYAKKLGISVYRFEQTMSHLSIALGQQVINLFVMGGLAAAYASIYTKYAVMPLNPKFLPNWVLVVVMSDLIYYCAHRASHRVNLFIAAHSVHHQAKDYNTASALRLPWINRPLVFIFYVPMAILGVPPEMMVAGVLFNLFVGSFAHNAIIRRKLGWIEYVFVTPRTHYVHHGVSGKYLDKNFGGVFIFWDRLFGSFEDLDEKDAVVFPGAESPDHLDPIRANFDYFGKILFVARRSDSVWEKFSIFFRSPETLEKKLSAHGYREVFDVRDPAGSGRWSHVFFFFGTTAGVLGALAYGVNVGKWSYGWLGALSAGVFLGTWLTGRALKRLPVAGKSAQLKAPVMNLAKNRRSTHRRSVARMAMTDRRKSG